MGRLREINVSELRGGKDFISLAAQKGATIEHGKGDHEKVKYNGAMVVVPMHRELATGTRFSILKAFKAMGLLAIFLYILSIVAPGISDVLY